MHSGWRRCDEQDDDGDERRTLGSAEFPGHDGGCCVRREDKD